LLDLVTKYHLENTVIFSGFIDRKDLPELYRHHSVLLFPSVWNEPMGISILEAMASGLVVISSGTGGSAELFVDGDSGLLFKSNDHEDLKQKVGLLLGNSGRIREMGLNAVQTCILKYQIKNTINLIKNYI